MTLNRTICTSRWSITSSYASNLEENVANQDKVHFSQLAKHASTESCANSLTATMNIHQAGTLVVAVVEAEEEAEEEAAAVVAVVALKEETSNAQYSATIANTERIATTRKGVENPRKEQMQQSPVNWRKPTRSSRMSNGKMLNSLPNKPE